LEERFLISPPLKFLKGGNRKDFLKR